VNIGWLISSAIFLVYPLGVWMCRKKTDETKSLLGGINS